MITLLPWVWSIGPAHGATWTYRVPVPVHAPGDDRGFRVCLDLPARLEIEPTQVDADGLTLTCESTEETTSLCYEVTGDWPSSWTSLSCSGPQTRVQIEPVPAFDFDDTVLDGSVTIVRGIDEVAAVFALPPGLWPEQTYEGERDTLCRVKEGRLWIWREGTGRRRDFCEIRDRYGDTTRFKVRFGRLR